jgi:hypothetical protein
MEVAREHLVWSSSLTILSQLISWRHLDMIGAESLADAVSAHLTCIGVKHPFELLRQLVTDGGVRTAYLSHPISRPRRTHAVTGDWPAVVEDSNVLAERLARRQTILICPTAIDEYRLASSTPTFEWDTHQRDLRLSERWPTLANETDAIEMSNPSSDLRQIPVTGAEIDLSDRSHYAKTLDDLIFAEVPFRDHFLVQHTDSFLVYRPHYADGKFSGGVLSEIEHWQNATRYDNRKRQALFVHTAEDVQAWMHRYADDHPERLRKSARQALLDSGYSAAIADAVLEGSAVGRDMLDSEPFGQTSQQEIERRVFTIAVEAVFYDGLTGLPADFYMDELLRARAPVFFIAGDAATDAEVDEIGLILNMDPLATARCMEAFSIAVQGVLGTDPHSWAVERLRGVPGD